MEVTLYSFPFLRIYIFLLCCYIVDICSRNPYDPDRGLSQNHRSLFAVLGHCSRCSVTVRGARSVAARIERSCPVVKAKGRYREVSGSKTGFRPSL